MALFAHKLLVELTHRWARTIPTVAKMSQKHGARAAPCAEFFPKNRLCDRAETIKQRVGEVATDLFFKSCRWADMLAQPVFKPEPDWPPQINEGSVAVGVIGK